MAVNAGLTFIVIALIFMLSNVISLKKITTFIANTPSNTSSEVATHAFDNMELSAKSVYVYDVVNQKVLYEKSLCHDFIQCFYFSRSELRRNDSSSRCG